MRLFALGFFSAIVLMLLMLIVHAVREQKRWPKH
jgi:hypothetical protein